MYEPVENPLQLHQGKLNSNVREINQVNWSQLLGLRNHQPVFLVDGPKNMGMYEDRRNVLQISQPTNTFNLLQALQREEQNQQLVQSLHASYNFTHDHNYCAKDVSDNNIAQNQPDDHNYSLISRELPTANKNMVILPDVLPESGTDDRLTPIIKEQSKLDNVDKDEDIQIQDQSKFPVITNECDYILPDVARNQIPISTCSNCNHNCNATEIIILKSQLEQKSIALNSCLEEIDLLRQKLGTANEHIVNLRAQLEENTHALCAYLANSNEFQQ